jgi:coproporphyrinogen III oxidase-like Fe-S oxidoreductase
MGVYFQREKEPELYRDTYDEAQRLIRISEQVRLSAEKVEETEEQQIDNTSVDYDKLTTSKLAKALGIKTGELTDRLLEKGFIERDDGQLKLTKSGKDIGGEFRYSKKYGPYFIWPKEMVV